MNKKMSKANKKKNKKKKKKKKKKRDEVTTGRTVGGTPPPYRDTFLTSLCQLQINEIISANPIHGPRSACLSSPLGYSTSKSFKFSSSSEMAKGQYVGLLVGIVRFGGDFA